MKKFFNWFLKSYNDYFLYQRLKAMIIINFIFLLLSPLLILQYFLAKMYITIYCVIGLQILVIFCFFLIRKGKNKLSVFLTIFSWQILFPLSLIFFDNFNNIFEIYRISFLLFIATMLSVIIITNKKFIYLITLNNILIIFISFIFSFKIQNNEFAISSYITCLIGFIGIAMLGDYISGFINFLINKNK